MSSEIGKILERRMRWYQEPGNVGKTAYFHADDVGEALKAAREEAEETQTESYRRVFNQPGGLFTIRLECKHGIEFWSSDEADKITWQDAARQLGCECSKLTEVQ